MVKFQKIDNNFRSFYQVNKIKMALENKYDTSVPLKFVSKVKLTIEDERMSKYYDQLTSESIYKLPLAIRNTNTEKGFGIHAT